MDEAERRRLKLDTVWNAYAADELLEWLASQPGADQSSSTQRTTGRADAG